MAEKNILVIGASSGIGAALTQLLNRENYRVFALSRHQPDFLPLPNVTPISWDVRQTPTPELINQLPDTLHGCIYLPGSIHLKPFHRLTPADFREEWELNVLGAITHLQAFLPHLKKAGEAAVILFSSVAAQTGMSFHASTASAKAAVEGLGKALAAEWAPLKIRVNVIAPSLTDTPLAGHLLATPEKREAAGKRHPLNRTGTPAEVAALAQFLLSDAAAWMTGQVIAMDGGLSSLR
ncbi:SDR family NAD(P)-dependent oxidoreductase [Adhaeribacter pallidiroseus]|uniref:3-hydroxybutyrate dehydrogenase n=1 Tax=Adhaeribacter pallidiroseus TaxID=2072847 RepID=A0A369QFD4_9BACT|nr:SDR family oxidoreductase [Adhaeribacter pallidiroseus]RDC61977.1 3-hydroxybutyrate dehydrogenase [Adhaeribacter pallidiroseus]